MTDATSSHKCCYRKNIQWSCQGQGPGIKSSGNNFIWGI